MTGTVDTLAGAHWQPIGPNTSGGHLAFTPAAPSRLYVLPDAGNNVFRSDDHGLTWRQPGWLGVPQASGVRLAADPRDADVVWVAATVPGSREGYVLRSNDGAKTFHSVMDSPTDITDVVVSPTGQQVFAAGTAGVYESLDRGVHWTLIPGSPGQVSRLALDDDDLFVGTDKALYLVEDALRNPRAVRKLPLPGDIFVQHLSVHHGLVLASQDGNAVISTDHGRSWRALTGPWVTDWVVFSALTANGEIQVQSLQSAVDGTSAARNLWISADHGRTWNPRPKAFTAVNLYTDLGSFPDRPDEEVVTGPAGTFTTRDSVRYRRIGVPATRVEALAVSGTSLVAGTAVDSYRSRAPLSEHLPAGYQDWGWTGQSPPTFGNVIGALAALPGRGLLRTRNAFCPDSCIALERSSDGGANWQTMAFVGGSSRSLAVDPRHPSNLYVGAYGILAGVYSSTDGGLTLEPHYLPGLESVRSVAVDRRADGSLWIGDVTGLYLSRDSGATAVKVLTGEVERVAVDPQDPDHIVVVGDNLITVSRDGGATFSDAAGFPAATYDDVTFAPDGTVFAASGDAVNGPGAGVVRSADGGTHWTQVSTALPDGDVRAVLVSPDGRWLFAGTGRSGVYRIALRHSGLSR